jgi:hypothetical protein
MLNQSLFAAILGISLVGCGASVASLPTGPTSTPVTVASPDVDGYTVIAGTNNVARGGQLSVRWTSAIGYVEDTISLSKVGVRDVAGWGRPTGAATSGTFTFTAPTEPGQYEFRYLLEDLSVAARSSLVTVE